MMNGHIEKRDQVFDDCYAAGGFPIRHNNGSYLLCLSNDAIITPNGTGAGR